jgi:hypothetical protein
MADLETQFRELASEIAVGASADGELKVTEFFRIFSRLAAENGDCPDLDYAPVLHDANGGYRVDGYAIDIPEGSDGASGDLHLAICSYCQDETLVTINAKEVDRAVAEVERFLRYAVTDRALNELEEESPTYRLALHLRQYLPMVARVRVLVFTNAKLQTRRKVFESRLIGKLPLTVNVFDIERYAKISSAGSDPVEVSFNEDFEGAIPCLAASTKAGGYSSYLFAIPGKVLADVYAAYGSRLLEQNVRTYLQARTGVNKGILKTIADEPDMFFAYNNGLTATASAVETEDLGAGIVGIARIRDFQIVNGGQTTASLLYARDGMGRDLSKVYVQVKLSVIEEGRLGEIVPKISEYANTQNKVSLADLAANSPSQIRIERLSKEVQVPLRDGAMHSTKWFYERARGQYKNLFAYKTASQRLRLETEFPKSQLIEKTDLAKFELSFDGRPHHVSEGAQKCFARYVTSFLSHLGAELGENWFKFAVAKAIIFRSLDHQISRSDWYKADKGLKAQTVTYAISASAHAFRTTGLQIDLRRIWNEQEVPAVLLAWMLKNAKRVHGILNNPPGSAKNPGEFSKKEYCWTDHVRGCVPAPARPIAQFGVPLSEHLTQSTEGLEETRGRTDLAFDASLANLVPRAAEIRERGQKRQLLSVNSRRAIDKLEIARLNFTKAERNSLKRLLERLGIDF